MKTILYLLLLIPSLLLAQNPKQLTPTGPVMRISPFANITGAAEQNMYSDTLAANSLQKFMKARFTVKANVSTGVSLSTLTLRFVNGANTVTLLNVLGLTLSMTNRPLTISGEITNQGNGTGLVYIVVSQDGTVINSVSTYYGVRRIWSMNFANPQEIQLKATVAGLGLGATTIGIDEIETQGF